MAIIIPSSKTYDKQNPKVRDNVIERIEVSAVEVVPDNKYKEPVKNLSFFESKGEQADIIDIVKSAGRVINPSATILSYQQTILQTKVIPYYTNIKVSFKLSESNHRITEIFEGKDKDDNNNIHYTLSGDTLKQEISARATGSGVDGGATVNIGQISYGEELIHATTSFNIDTEIKNEKTLTVVTTSTVDANVSLSSGNISTAKGIKTEDEYTIDLNILTSVEIYTLSAEPFTNTSTDPSFDVLLNGHYEKKICDRLELTFYGSALGIDLTDKTVYIPETDTTSKKVFSVEGNELMQTTNTTGGIEKWSMRQGTDYRFEVVEITNPPVAPRAVIDGVRTIIYFLTDKAVKATKTIILVNGTSYSVGAGVSNYSISGSVLIREIRGEVDGIVPAITGLYEKTKAQYALGKETATIRCSISDYFDYDSGNKIISIDNSTGKMSFSTYDQVIPMVYGADGKDRPMSLYQDGTPKVFAVLGTKIYYDGAVWQELSLQEVDKNEIV